MNTVGVIVQQRLDEKGWSVRELARRADLPQATVHKVLCGETIQPRPGTLEAIARPLGLSPRLLMEATIGDPNEPNPDGFELLVAGLRALPHDRRAEVAALVEAMLSAQGVAA